MKPYVKNDLWKKYGFCIMPSVPNKEAAEKRHDMVVAYLEKSPARSEEYLRRPRYNAILILAENEAKTKNFVE